jgi:hypothetical protein
MDLRFSLLIFLAWDSCTPHDPSSAGFVKWNVTLLYLFLLCPIYALRWDGFGPGVFPGVRSCTLTWLSLRHICDINFNSVIDVFYIGSSRSEMKVIKNRLSTKVSGDEVAGRSDRLFEQLARHLLYICMKILCLSMTLMTLYLCNFCESTLYVFLQPCTSSDVQDGARRLRLRSCSMESTVFDNASLSQDSGTVCLDVSFH